MVDAGVALSGDGRMLVPGSCGWPVLVSPGKSLLGRSGTDALVGGTVFFDVDADCLYLQNGDDLVPVLWPAGTSWHPDLPAVIIEGVEVEPGMLVAGGGGFVDADGVEERAGPEVANAAKQCAGTTGEVIYFNQDSDIAVEG